MSSKWYIIWPSLSCALALFHQPPRLFSKIIVLKASLPTHIYHAWIQDNIISLFSLTVNTSRPFYPGWSKTLGSFNSFLIITKLICPMPRSKVNDFKRNQIFSLYYQYSNNNQSTFYVYPSLVTITTVYILSLSGQQCRKVLKILIILVDLC